MIEIFFIKKHVLHYLVLNLHVPRPHPLKENFRIKTFSFIIATRLWKFRRLIYLKIASVILVCVTCTVLWGMFALRCTCHLITLRNVFCILLLSFPLILFLRCFLCSLVLTRKNNFTVADVGWGQLRNSYQFNCNSQNQSGCRSCDEKSR